MISFINQGEASWQTKSERGGQGSGVAFSANIQDFYEAFFSLRIFSTVCLSISAL